MKEYMKFVFVLLIILSLPSWAQDEEAAKLGEVEATGSVLSNSASVGYEKEREKEINELVTVQSTFLDETTHGCRSAGLPRPF